MLSGHTHYGQIFPFNYLVCLQFKTVYSLFEQKNLKLFVSLGSGTWGPRLRFGTQNEILQVQINLISNRGAEIWGSLLILPLLNYLIFSLEHRRIVRF